MRSDEEVRALEVFGEVDLDGVQVGDVERLEQQAVLGDGQFETALVNLITNAIKYTKTGGILLSVKKDGKRIVFAVKDTGIGISKTDQKKIFDKFYRSEDYRTRETSGTGLGLYVVNKLARKLGVNIEITSRLNHGSTFSFTLPLK